MSTQLLTWCQLALWVVSASLFGPAARAAMVPFALKDATRDTGWSIVYDDTQISVVSFTGIATGNKEGTLQLDKTFNSFNVINISFVESAAEIAKASNFGLRITMNENVHNLSGVNWTGFTEMLIDNNPISPQDDPGNHAGFAHFHPDSISTPPWVVLGGNGPGMNSKPAFSLGGGAIFPNNSAQAWSGIGIHQFEDQGAVRNFILQEAPFVPLPASSLAGSVLLGAVAVARGVRRR